MSLTSAINQLLRLPTLALWVSLFLSKGLTKQAETQKDGKVDKKEKNMFLVVNNLFLNNNI